MRYLRLIIGLLVLVAIFFQYFTFVSLGTLSAPNYFSYFTVLSNFIFAVALINSIYGFIPKIRPDMIRGFAVLSVILTGFGFTVLLGGKNDDFLPWVNFILHYFSPVWALLDWFIIPATSIYFKDSLKWLLTLAIYFVYTLVRGRITSWYPYDFVNPHVAGVLGVSTYAAALLGISLLVSVLLIRKYR